MAILDDEKKTELVGGMMAARSVGSLSSEKSNTGDPVRRA